MSRGSVPSRVALALLLALLAAAPAQARDEGVRELRAVVRDLEAKVELMELSARRYARWRTCLGGVPVSEYGDPDRRFGFVYDDRDGTPLSFMPALGVDRRSRPRREDYLFLRLSRARGCDSKEPTPGGTAEPAFARRPDARRGGTLAALERRVRRLKGTVRRLTSASERFDAWESCVSLVPVTEYGDPDGGFGYVFGGVGTSLLGLRPALAVDRSDWDDPDYMFLAFVGGDRPGKRCRNEPGEGID